jgi:hypothetical protein
MKLAMENVMTLGEFEPNPREATSGEIEPSQQKGTK